VDAGEEALGRGGRGAHWWRGGTRRRRKWHSPAGRRRADEVAWGWSVGWAVRCGAEVLKANQRGVVQHGGARGEGVQGQMEGPRGAHGCGARSRVGVHHGSVVWTLGSR
jgi:hypothetical protein